MSLSMQEQVIRSEKIQQAMRGQGIDALVISSSTNLFYVLGEVINGYVVLFQQGAPIVYQRKPVLDEATQGRVAIRKVEDILPHLAQQGFPLTELQWGFELDVLSVNEYQRLHLAFESPSVQNSNGLLRQVRAIKTAVEVELMRQSATLHTQLYNQIPDLYREGMTDYEMEVEIEYVARKMGSLGIFRIFGSSMEIFMGSVLGGENGLTPSPYDFSMGGKGMHGSLPVGASGQPIQAGQTLMVDVGGNFTGYMSDMTRTYAIAQPSSALALRAHQASITIHEELAKRGVPGAVAMDLYQWALEYAKAQGLADYYMGYAQKAAFIGHGVGIEINEVPVISGRSKEVLQVGMVLALEPKFTIPGVGAVGIEDTYLVTETGLELLTHTPRELQVLGMK